MKLYTLMVNVQFFTNTIPSNTKKERKRVPLTMDEHNT